MVGELAVVVVNYGSSELLRANLAPLAAAMPEARIVVVDNFSGERERAAIVALGTERGWVVVTPSDNLGFGLGMNAGVDAAIARGATRFLLLNPDATIERDAVETLSAAVAAEPFALLAPRILRPDGSVWFDGSDLNLDDGRITATRKRAVADDPRLELWLSGACLMVSAELWERIGGFGDGYFLYWEDVELSYRARRAGASVRVVDAATAVHAEGGTQGDGLETAGAAKSEGYYYFNIRNRLVFAARNLDAATVRRWRRASLPIAWEVLLQGGRRQFAHPVAPVRAAFTGVRDGLRASRKR